ncbi:MAG: FAD-dependent oxidoreductase, partial [Planctomycetaceae bacterium]
PIRAHVASFGLPKDEFPEKGGWPRMLYIREARRMVGEYVMTEHECRGVRKALRSVGLAAYTMDSHNVQRYAQGGRVFNEGDVQVGGFPPYPISYRAIVPREAECPNLFVPVCLSASHIAYGSIRMEPVFMVLGESAALAADLTLRDDIPVQQVPYARLRERLLEARQVLQGP